jgi:pimeloyl-ACP methyl ester carboxylesterase
VLIQTGTRDVDITWISQVFGRTAPNTTLKVYEGQGHGVDLLQKDAVNAQSFRDMCDFSGVGKP